jgi:hypothetical protein
MGLDFLAELPTDQFDITIFKLIHECHETDNIEDAVTIIDFCENARIEIDPLPTITGLFYNDYFNTELLKWTTSLFEKEPTGYFLDIINSRDDDVAIAIAKSLVTIFPNITEKEWIQLAQLTEDFEDEEYENHQLREFLLAQSSNYATYPDWLVQDRDLEDIITSYPDDIPDPEKAVNLILDDLRRLKIGVTEVDDEDIKTTRTMKENLIAQYSITTSLERRLMLGNVIKIKMFDDTPLFREYGPLNSSYSCSSVIDEDHECLKHGGCRMLICNEFPETDIFGEPIDLTAKSIITTDWFKKKCNECKKKIRSKHHALRLPLLYGGWQGCYCSFDCLKKKVNDPITALIVGRMKNQINTIGINDK